MTLETKAPAATAGIELRDLRRTYATPAGPVEAVRDVDLAIARGETVALLGPNGAGKSTTIDVLLGLQAPDAGTVALCWEPPADAIARGRVGAMMQSGGLLHHLTARELVGLMDALHPAPLAVDGALDLAGVEEIAGRRVEKLSGGQAQRVRFALALAATRSCSCPTRRPPR